MSIAISQTGRTPNLSNVVGLSDKSELVLPSANNGLATYLQKTQELGKTAAIASRRADSQLITIDNDGSMYLETTEEKQKKNWRSKS